jgi:epsilon-lactone hydrolase
MSWQMRVTVTLMRRVGQPRMRRLRSPERGFRDFERGARALLPPPYAVRLERPLGGRPAHWIWVGTPHPRRVVLWLHGGAFFSGSGRTHAALLARLSALSGLEMVAPDYRLLQEAPFPAAFEDALAAWVGLRALGYREGDIALGGDSAGGGLALALLAHLLGRGERPAALVALSPWADLAREGTVRSDDYLPMDRVAEVVERYLAGADPRDPRASPAHANFPGAPPALIQVGSREALRPDAEAVAGRLAQGGGAVRLEVWPDAPHVWHALDGYLPEARAANRAVARFLDEALS